MDKTTGLEENLQGEFSIERLVGPDGRAAEIRSKRGADCSDLTSRWKTYWARFVRLKRL
jgi:hypothetical protein